MKNIKMLYYDRIDVYEGIDVNKTNKSKECDICYCCYFLSKGFKFLTYVCSRSHDLLMMSINHSHFIFQKLKMLIIVVLLVKLANVKL